MIQLNRRLSVWQKPKDFFHQILSFIMKRTQQKTPTADKNRDQPEPYRPKPLFETGHAVSKYHTDCNIEMICYFLSFNQCTKTSSKLSSDQSRATTCLMVYSLGRRNNARSTDAVSSLGLTIFHPPPTLPSWKAYTYKYIRLTQTEMWKHSNMYIRRGQGTEAGSTAPR